jgi:hypothetical protein
MLTGRDMTAESPTDSLHVAVIGAEKNGKSTLASTAPGVKLFLDFDQRAEAVAGRKDVYAITFRDPQWPKMPEVAEEVIDVMTGLEGSLDLSKLRDKKNNAVFSTAKPETFVKNLIFDSMSSFAKCMMSYELYNSKDLRREIRIGTKLEIHVPKGYDAWNAETGGVQSIIMRALALPINIFCIFHETSEESDDSTNEKPKYTGRITIYPVRYKALLKYFNEVWRVKLTPIGGAQGVRYLPRVYPLPDYAMDAATAMLLDSVEEPNIEGMIAKHRSRVVVKK